MVTNNASGGATLVVGSANANSTFYGTIENGTSSGGTVGLDQSGTGELQLGGTDSSSGWVEANGGTLQMTSSTALGSSANLEITSGTTFDLHGYSETFNCFGGSSGSVVTNSAPSTSATLLMGADNGYGGFYGTLENGTGPSGGVVDFEKAGTGSFTLGGTDSSTGSLEAYGGTFALATSTSTNTTIWVMAGTLQVAYASALSSTPELYIYGGTLDLAGYSETLNDLYGSSSATITSNSSGTPTLTVDSGTFSGTMENGSGTVALVKNTSGTLTLGGTNYSTGGTTINAGYVDLGSSSALYYGGGVTINGGTLDLEGYGPTIDALAGSGGLVTNSGPSASLTAESGTSSTFSGTIQNGSGTGQTLSLVKLGTGTLALDSYNGYTGATTIEGGTLLLGSSTAAGYGGIVLDNTGYGATLDLNGQSVSNSLSSTGAYGGTITSSSAASISGTITIGSSGLTVTDALALSLGGTISGPGSLTKSGAGTLTLTGTDTYSGGTTINSSGGTLQLGNGSSIGTVAGNITDNATLAIDYSSNQPFGNAISGSGIVNLLGAGILTVTTAGTYSGATNVEDGTLQAGGFDVLSASSTYAIGSGGTLDLGGNSQTIGSVSGAGVATDSTAGPITLTTGGDNTSTTFSGVIQNGSGTVALTQNGTGTLTLTETNTFTGATTITEGAVQLGYGSSMGSVAGNIADNSALVFDNPSGQIYSGVISGNGSIAMNGAGALTFGGTSTGTGTMAINSGTLDVTGQMSNPISIGPNGTLDGPTSGNSTAMTGPVTNDGDSDLEQPFQVVDLGYHDTVSEFPLVSESLTYVNDSTTVVLALSVEDAAFKTFSGSATTHENSTPYTFSPTNPPDSGPFSFTEGPNGSGGDARITFANPAPPGTYTDYGGYWDLNVTQVQQATLTVTNMAPLTFSASDILSQVALPSGFDATTATISGTADVRGGDLTQQSGGSWVYTPHGTEQNGSPWDPYHPYGDDPTGEDGAAGGASFTATLSDGAGNLLLVSVVLAAAHSGYDYVHLGDVIDAPVEGNGSLFLGGGGLSAAEYAAFGQMAGGGDIVVIAENNQLMPDIQADAQSMLGAGAHSVDIFSFHVNLANGTLTSDAIDVAMNNAGTGLGAEFIDKLKDASAVFFYGGNQWVYAQLLTDDTRAAGIISNGNNGNTVSVGGTSAGMAILGQYAYTSQYTQLGSGFGNLTSQQLLTDYTTPAFIQGGKVDISNGLLNINKLAGFILEPHFDRGVVQYTDPTGGQEHSDRKLGRMLTFMGAIQDPYFGLGQAGAMGIGIDTGSALLIDGPSQIATIYGSGNVIFADTTTTPFLHSSTTSPVVEATQLDVPNVDIRWFAGAVSFAFGSGVVSTPAEGGTAATVSLTDGNIAINAGTLPSPEFYPQ